MTLLMDKLFISIGFDEEELKKSTMRGLLYMGIIFMLGVMMSFLVMTILS